MKQLSRKVAEIRNTIDGKQVHSMPEWKCYCCEDRGFISNHLVCLVIKDYDHWTDFHPICNRCNAKNEIPPAFMDRVDDRFDKETCDELHEFNYQQQQEMVQRLNSQPASQPTIDSRGEVVTNDPTVGQFLKQI